jgi:predicted PurR-regulated permease PerM
MTTNRMSAIALVLSAVTLVVVLIVAARVVPQATDSGPALSALQYDMSEMQANIAALRSIAERPPATPNPITDPIAAMQARFDSLDAAVGAIATKFATLCTAINSSPFAPSGGAC